MLKSTFVALPLVLTIVAPAFANGVSNSTYTEQVKGTRDVNSQSHTRGTSYVLTQEQSIKLDGSGDGAKGDIYFRNGQLSGGFWSKDNANAHGQPGFVAGQVETKTTIDNITFSNSTQSTDWSSYTGKLNVFTLD